MALALALVEDPLLVVLLVREQVSLQIGALLEAALAKMALIVFTRVLLHVDLQRGVIDEFNLTDIADERSVT